MRIVVDGRMLSWTGIGRYTLALLEGLMAIDQTNEYLVLIARRTGHSGLRPPTTSRAWSAISIPYTVAEQTRLRRVLDGLKADVVHLVTPNAAVLYKGRKVVTVADLTLLDFDTSRGSLGRRVTTKLKRLPFRLIFRRQVNTATHVVTLTEYVRSQLVARFRLDPAKITPAWLAADSDHLTVAEEEPLADVESFEPVHPVRGQLLPLQECSTPHRGPRSRRTNPPGRAAGAGRPARRVPGRPPLGGAVARGLRPGAHARLRHRRPAHVAVPACRHVRQPVAVRGVRAARPRGDGPGTAGPLLDCELPPGGVRGRGPLLRRARRRRPGAEDRRPARESRPLDRTGGPGP